MIKSRLSSASATMATASRLRDDKAAVEKLNADLSSLKSTAVSLHALIDVIQAMQDSNIANGVLSSEHLLDLNKSINICGEKASTYKLTESDVSALQSILKTCRLAADQAWTKEASASVDGVYGSLNSLKDLLPNRQLTDNLLQRLAVSKATLPKNKTAVVTFVSDLTEAQKLVSSLELDAQIEVFITKVLTQTATLTDLDAHVLQWIKANNLTGKMKIRF